jgi:hypothetical protein
MPAIRPLHPSFRELLELKEMPLVNLFTDLRNYVLDLFPQSCELLYHTHALTAVFSVSEKLSDAYCMIPIYTAHLNLGFNKGTLLPDAHQLLQGTGNLIRHIPVQLVGDYRNPRVKKLLKAAYDFALSDSESNPSLLLTGTTLSKMGKTK